MQPTELGNFLRIRRQAMKLEDSGLISMGPRRTPGLRREEVAMLAGVGSTWYTWLEQGRAKGVSSQVLRGLARALHLTVVETNYLYQLAGMMPPHDSIRPVKIPTHVQVTLDGMQWPAYVIDYQWNIIGWNKAAVALYEDFDKLTPRDRHILRFLLLNSRQKDRLVDWREEGRNAVALFRSTTAVYAKESWHRELVAELRAGCSDFADWWEMHTVASNHDKAKRIKTKDGTVEVATVILNVQGQPGMQIHIQPLFVSSYNKNEPSLWAHLKSLLWCSIKDDYRTLVDL